MIERDSLHYTFREIDGYGKDINIVMSSREPGKSTNFWLDKVYFPWKKDKRPWIMMARHAVEVTEEMLYTIQEQYLNKFLPDDERVEFKFKTTGLGSKPIIDIRVDNEVLFRIVSLNAEMRIIKSCLLPRARGAFMDEFIVNPKFGEKYLKDEWGIVQEAFTTWRRATTDGKFKLYLLGNPYSLYNPYFMGLGIDITKLKRGSFYVGNDFVIQWALLNPLLREKLLKENPMLRLDEDYGNYALDGYATNDEAIRIGEQPKNFTLNMIVKFGEKYIGFFKNNYVDDLMDIYHCRFIDNFSSNRNVFAFNFEDMVRSTQLFTRDDKSRFYRFRVALSRNLVTFSSPAVYYMIIEIYKYL